MVERERADAEVEAGEANGTEVIAHRGESGARSDDARSEFDAGPPPRWLPLVRPVALAIAILGALGAIVLAVLHGRASGERSGAHWDPTTNGPALVGSGLALLPALLAGAVLVFRPERGTYPRLALTTATWIVTLLAVLGGLWAVIATRVDLTPQVGTPVLSNAEVDAYLAEAQSTLPALAAAPIQIPTGVLIQSVEFLNANNVQVTGFIWQSYAPNMPASIARGFVLPEAVQEAYQGVEAYRLTREDGTEVIGWYFSAVLREAFDYQRYPFDRQDVWLRLWHRDFERGVILVPDFASYETTDPSALAGVDPMFVYGAWDPHFSVFSFDVPHYRTNFGYNGSTSRGGFPELYFSIGLKRDFWGPFFDHVTLFLAVAVLLFGVLMLTTNDSGRRERFGALNTAGVFGACTGLLFTSLIEQNQIRTIVAGQQVAYLEVLPFLLNGAIGLVAFNSILLNSERPARFVTYRNNLLPDLLYWPVLLLAIIVATLIAFFL